MLTVLEIAPERNGWAAAIILMWACQAIDRVPFVGWNAQSKTGRCSSRSSGAPSIVSCSSMYLTIASICGRVVAQGRAATAAPSG